MLSSFIAQHVLFVSAKAQQDTQLGFRLNLLPGHPCWLSMKQRKPIVAERSRRGRKGVPDVQSFSPKFFTIAGATREHTQQRSPQHPSPEQWRSIASSWLSPSATAQPFPPWPDRPCAVASILFGPTHARSVLLQDVPGSFLSTLPPLCSARVMARPTAGR